jgi:hypothetical protein
MGAVPFLEMSDLAFEKRTNMDVQDRGHVSFLFPIVGQFFANFLIEERSPPKSQIIPILFILCIHVCLPTAPKFSAVRGLDPDALH